VIFVANRVVWITFPKRRFRRVHGDVEGLIADGGLANCVARRSRGSRNGIQPDHLVLKSSFVRSARSRFVGMKRQKDDYERRNRHKSGTANHDNFGSFFQT
jgi:hypothetical protein